MKVNSQEEVREAQLRLLGTLKAQINIETQLELDINGVSAFMFRGLEFKGIRQLNISSLGNKISATDVIKIEVSILNFMAENGFAVYAYDEWSDRPCYVVFKDRPCEAFEVYWEAYWNAGRTGSLIFWICCLDSCKHKITTNEKGDYVSGRRIVRYKLNEG